MVTGHFFAGNSVYDVPSGTVRVRRPMESTAHLWIIVPLLGFALAFVFGAVAQRTGFCAMGAVSDVVNMGDWGRMRMWLLAIAVAILGANLLRLARAGRSWQVHVHGSSAAPSSPTSWVDSCSASG